MQHCVRGGYREGLLYALLLSLELNGGLTKYDLQFLQLL